MADWWALGVPLLDNKAEVGTADLADAGVTTAKLADLNVTSEKISANALRRTVMVPLPDLGAASTGPLTSDYQVWKPTLPVVIRDVGLTPMTSWVQTTVQTTPVGTLFNGADAIADVAIPTTNAPVGGVRLAFSAPANANVAAGTALTFKLTASTSAGMNPPAHVLDISYDSTA